MVEGMSVVVNVMLSLIECDEPTSCLVQSIAAHCCEGMYFGCFDFSGDLDFLNCDDVYMCVLNKQFELLEYVFESVYVDLMRFLSLLLLSGCACVVFAALWYSLFCL